MKILIANDGSEFGEAAVDFCAGLVGSREANEFRIVTVVEPAASIELETIIESVDELASSDSPAVLAARKIAETSAERLRGHLGGGNQTISGEALVGPAARTIVEEATKWNADLIVLGSHGRGFWKRAWSGSVADRVAHHAQCSVLVVKQQTAE